MRTLLFSGLVLAVASLSSVSLAQPAPVAPPPAPPPPAAPPAGADAPPAAPAPAEAAPPATAGAPAPAAAPTDEAAAAADPVATQAGPPPPEQVAAAAAAPPAEVPAAPAPDRVTVAKQGFFKPGVLIQAWYLLQERGDQDISHYLRLRRAEFKASGEIVPGKVAYKLMADFAKVLEFEERTIDVDYEGVPDAGGTVDVQQPNRNVAALQDVEVTFKSRYLDLSVGQFKIPISYEALVSSSATMLPERPALTRRFGDFRDLGIRAEKKLGVFYYYVGLHNGNGINRPDNDNDKGASLRLQVSPVEGVTFAAAGYATVGERESANTKDMLEGDLILEFGDLLAQAEYIHGFTGPDSGEWEEAHGFYAALGYTLLERIQPVVRVGYLDPEVSRDLVSTDDEDEFWSVEGGLNCFLHERNVMLSVMGSGQLFDEGGGDFDGILALQLSY